MPRPQRNRKVHYPPKMKGFSPFGIVQIEKDSVVLNYDEFEAFRMVEYDHLSQAEVAEKMDVSRPTLTRIYNHALGKIAKAFVEGRSISIGGGNCRFEKDWHRCRKCHKLIQNPAKHIRCRGCKSFGVAELIPLNDSFEN
ncbi:MAG: DUF134 domain-containing protein [Petrimonas sp.]|nr:DUF134 domain-containing protein [Petrimonas sp.]